jgi:nicotinamidase-related amidase
MTSTALLIMDVQQGIVDRFAGHDGGQPVRGLIRALSRAATASPCA